MNNHICTLLLAVFCYPLLAQQPFSPGIRHQMVFSAGDLAHSNGKVYFTAAYEYELGRHFSIDLKSTVDAGSNRFDGDPALLKTSKPIVNDNPSGAWVKFQVHPEQSSLVTLSPRLQYHLLQNPANRIWIAAGPVAAYIRRTRITGIAERRNPVNGEITQWLITDYSMQRYLDWGLNAEIGYHHRLNKTVFLTANAGGLFLSIRGTHNTYNPRYFGTLGFGLSLGGYSKNIQ